MKVIFVLAVVIASVSAKPATEKQKLSQSFRENVDQQFKRWFKEEEVNKRKGNYATMMIERIT